MTGWNGTTPHWRAFTNQTDIRILRMWHEGMDTLDIARVIEAPEHVVANRLPHILEADRREAEWQ